MNILYVIKEPTTVVITYSLDKKVVGKHKCYSTKIKVKNDSTKEQNREIIDNSQLIGGTLLAWCNSCLLLSSLKVAQVQDE